MSAADNYYCNGYSIINFDSTFFATRTVMQTKTAQLYRYKNVWVDNMKDLYKNIAFSQPNLFNPKFSLQSSLNILVIDYTFKTAEMYDTSHQYERKCFIVLNYVGKCK